MSLDNAQRQAIERMFLQEIECATLLLQSLDLEYDALAEHHVETLEVVVGEKQQRVIQLETISRQRESLLESCDFVSTKMTKEKNKNYHFSDNKQLAELWKKLVIVAEKCQQKNRVNGSIVELVSKQSRHALDILHGILPDVTPVSELYDNTGQSIKSSNKRSLIQV